MTLRRKTLWTIGIVLIFLLIAIYEAASIMTRSATRDLEQREAAVNSGRAVDAIEAAIYQLNKSASDWANWDDSYEFMKDRNRKFVETNMTENAFASLGVNLIAFIDTDGRVVLGQSFDLKDEISAPLPQGLLEETKGDAPIMKVMNEGSSGIVMFADDPMMFAARPVLTSDGEGPARGLLLMGRWLNQAEMETLSAVTHLQLTLHRFGDVGVPSRPSGVTTRIIKKESIAAYQAIPDIDGKPAVVVEAVMPREIARLGERAITSLGIVLAGISVVFVMLVIMIIDKMVLSRIASLNRDVGEVADSGDPSKRVAMHGRDELAKLSEAINGMLGSIQLSQEELANNEKRLNAILNSTQAGFMIIDAESHTIVDVNPAAAAMIGLPKDGIVGANCQKFVCPADSDKCTITDLGQTVDNSEKVLLTADGRSLQIIKSVSNVELKGRKFLVESFVDISKRKTAEIELLHLSQKNESILNSAGEGIVGLDVQGRHVFVNPAAAEMLGYEVSELLGQVSHPIWHHTKKDGTPNEMEACPIYAALRDGRTHHELDDVFWKKDGAMFPVEYSSNPIFDGETIVGAVVAFRDITERKRSEEKLRLAGEELIRTSNMKSELTSMVSHELRTPLAAIKEALAIVLEGMNGPLNEQQQRTLGIASRNIDRLVNLTTEVLDFSKLESGKMEMHFANIDLGSLLQEIFADMKPVAEKKGVALQLELPGDGAATVCDGDRLRQVVTNLISNSLKFTKEGGSVRLALERDERGVRIKVSDTGIGIKESDMPRLFKVFGQIHDKDTAGVKGSGLGLVISKQIVEAHKGKIGMQSVYGEGSTFTVELPTDLQPA